MNSDACFKPLFLLLLSSALVLTACSLNSSKTHRVSSALTCDTTVQELAAIAAEVAADSFNCYRPSGVHVCSLSWKRSASSHRLGIKCIIGKDEKLVSCREYRTRSMTITEYGSEFLECSCGGDAWKRLGVSEVKL